jgi:AcrR family transcriptional regulator
MAKQKITPTKESAGVGPGRPLGFDPDHVLDTALSLFWRNGYAATSLDMIVEATGVARPSLARRFGDKAAIYVACLERFRTRLRATLGATLRERAPIEVTLLAFCDAAVSLYMTGGANPLGCLIINTAPSATRAVPEVQAVLRDALAEMDDALRSTLKAAQARGQLSPDVDATGVALLVSSLVQSLALRARAGERQRELKAVARRALAQIVSGLGK